MGSVWELQKAWPHFFWASTSAPALLPTWLVLNSVMESRTEGWKEKNKTREKTEEQREKEKSKERVIEVEESRTIGTWSPAERWSKKTQGQ